MATADRPSRPPATVVSADTLEIEALRRLFNEGYSGYLVPLELSESAFASHLANNDIDLSLSRVVQHDQPTSFALIARRGREAWVGGMGTVPARRRHGDGERVLAAALDAARHAGVTTVWLEVIAANQAARALYEKRGFATERELSVWSVSVDKPPPPVAPIDAQAGRDWIAAYRPYREPWQRADATLERMHARHVALGATVIDRGETRVAAAVYTEAAASTNVLQFAALDELAAIEALRAVSAATRNKPLRLANYPEDELLANALAELGAGLEVLQFEMKARLAAP